MTRHPKQAGLHEYIAVLSAPPPDVEGGYLKNCLILPRPDQRGSMFRQVGTHILAFLDGYAILPREFVTQVELDAIMARSRAAEAAVGHNWKCHPLTASDDTLQPDAWIRARNTDEGDE